MKFRRVPIILRVHLQVCIIAFFVFFRRIRDLTKNQALIHHTLNLINFWISAMQWICVKLVAVFHYFYYVAYRVPKTDSVLSSTCNGVEIASSHIAILNKNAVFLANICNFLTVVVYEENQVMRWPVLVVFGSSISCSLVFSKKKVLLFKSAIYTVLSLWKPSSTYTFIVYLRVCFCLYIL